MTALDDLRHTARREVSDVALAHLRACEEAMFAADTDDDAEREAAWRTSPAVAPYDGDDCCQVREVLAVAWPLILQHAAEVLALYQDTEQATAILVAEANLAKPVPMGVPS